MRRFFSLFTMMMLCSVLSFAQSRLVTGRVIDASGKPVPFASVVIKGGGGVQTDANGEYQIRVSSGDVLVVSQASFEAVEIPVGSLSTINTTLKMKENTIPEVVVTSAFNIKRTARSSSANAQNVSSEQLNTVRQQNVNDALAGKVAGAQVRSQSSGKLGAENIVRLRGENGIAGVGNGPIYVVNGTIVSQAGDINVDDIEDLNVLQGPAAAALFGAQGANGAIVITTKRARKVQKGIGLEWNSAVTFDKVYILPNYQNTYAGGTLEGGHDVSSMLKFDYVPGFHPESWASLDGKYYIANIEDESWGPKMVGQEYIPWYSWYPGHERSGTTAKLNPQPNNARSFYSTGVTLLNNVSFSKAGDGYNLRVSYTNRDQKGIIPTSYLKRHNLNVSSSFNLSSKFSVDANLNFLVQKTNAENDDGYSNNTTGSFNQWFHREIDMDIMRELRGYRNQYGQLASWNHVGPDAYNPNNPRQFFAPYYWFNPYSWQDNVSNIVNKNRTFGDISLTYKPTNDFNVRLTYRRNQLSQNDDTRQYNVLAISNDGRNSSGFNYWETISGRSATWQGFGYGTNNAVTHGGEILASYNKKYRDLNFDANAGLSLNRLDQETTAWNSLGGLTVADEFLIGNSKQLAPVTRNITRNANRAVFGRLGVGYKNYAFVDGTYRADYYSTQNGNDPINTFSGGVSLILSDIFGLNNNPVLNYLKLRASIGQISSALNTYQNTVVYNPSTNYPVNYNGDTRMATVPDRLVDPSLMGTTNTEKEIGVEARFFKSRFTFNATYWDRTNKDFPYDVSIYPGTGYTQLSTNTGKIVKKGIELQATVVPVRKPNFSWTASATWGYLLNNKVVNIKDSIPATPSISGGQAGTNAYVINEVGQQWGQLVGRGIKRIDGKPVIDPTTGLFVLDRDSSDAIVLKHYGSVLPRYTGGIQNTFTVFKNFTVNVNIDYSSGGKFFSLSRYYGFATGLMKETAAKNDKGFSVRDDVEVGGGVHVVGVDEDGKPVDMYVRGSDYFRQFAYGDGIVEPMIQDLTFVKLRELSLGYNLPISRMGGISKYITNATFSIVARDPWLLYAKAKGFDPSQISTNYGEDGQFPGTRSMGVNLKVGF